MTGNAARAAVGFTLCAGIGLFCVSAIILGDHNGSFRPFLYTVAGGVCIALLWPSQDDGDALLKRKDE